MDQLLYWLDRGDGIASLQHAWIWVSLTTILAISTIFGIAAISRHYATAERGFDHQSAQG